MPTASDKRFRHLMDSAPALIWSTDTNRQFTFVNKVWLNFTGRTLEQEAGEGWLSGVHPADRDRCLAMFIGHFDTLTPFRVEYRLRRHDGAWRWLLDHGVPRYDEDGGFAGFIGSCIDITDMKDLELQRQQDLVDKAALLQELHHRVKNNAQLFASLLQIQASRAGDAAVQAALRTAASRASAMTIAQEQMHEAGSAAAFDLGSYANTLVQTARLQDGDRITVAVEAPEPVLVPLRDAVSLGLILNELLVNALIHAFPDGRRGRVTIMLWREPDRSLSLVVADDGLGMAPGRDLGGTATAGGMIVRSLARQLEATLSVKTEGGTRVALVLPPPG